MCKSFLASCVLVVNLPVLYSPEEAKLSPRLYHIHSLRRKKRKNSIRNKFYPLYKDDLRAALRPTPVKVKTFAEGISGSEKIIKSHEH